MGYVNVKLAALQSVILAGRMNVGDIVVFPLKSGPHEGGHWEGILVPCWGQKILFRSCVPDENFPDVPLDVVDPSKWKTSLMGKWRSEEHITLKEGRALVLCLCCLVRSSRHRNKRHVILVDDLGLALCISKGRAKMGKRFQDA